MVRCFAKKTSYSRTSLIVVVANDDFGTSYLFPDSSVVSRALGPRLRTPAIPSEDPLGSRCRADASSQYVPSAQAMAE